MKQIVKDWMDFCEKDAAFPDGYFYTLFMEDITLDDINQVYQYFPNSEILIEKMAKFLFGTKPLFTNYDNRIEQLRNLITRDFKERLSIVPKLDVFKNLDLNAALFIENIEIVNKLILDDIWSQSFHDYMRSQKISNEKKMFELYNALHGITFDFDYQLYLFNPLLKTDYNNENLFEFKRLGGVYAITDEGVIYSFKNE